MEDSTLDKPYAKQMDLVHRHWSGKHHRVVDEINLITLLWTEGEAYVPCDWRVFDRPNDGETKNDCVAAMLLTAKRRGFMPECVLFDRWYAAIDNLRLVRACGWRRLTRFKSNRRMNINRQGHRCVRTGEGWAQAKRSVYRFAVRRCLTHPRFVPPSAKSYS